MSLKNYRVRYILIAKEEPSIQRFLSILKEDPSYSEVLNLNISNKSTY
jgi:hypothetical protein